MENRLEIMNFYIKFRKAVVGLSLFFSFSYLESEQYPIRYERFYCFKDCNEMNVDILERFLPYNPVIVEGGAYCGGLTSKLSKLWPRGQIYAFEPNPRAFDELQKMISVEGLANIIPYNLALADYTGPGTFYVCHGTYGKSAEFEFASSLLRPTQEMEIHYQGPKIEVSCVNLDDWCREKQVDHIDLLILELQGMEFQVLISSPEILQNVKAIYTQTNFFPFREGMINYFILKSFLETMGFVVLEHLYRQGHSGNAIFLSRELFDGYFKYSVGLKLGV
jgi:2-O-methyltransferase